MGTLVCENNNEDDHSRATKERTTFGCTAKNATESGPLRLALGWPHSTLTEKDTGKKKLFYVFPLRLKWCLDPSPLLCSQQHTFKCSEIWSVKTEQHDIPGIEAICTAQISHVFSFVVDCRYKCRYLQRSNMSLYMGVQPNENTAKKVINQVALKIFSCSC